MPMNIMTDESPEAVEAIVGIIDRRMREINLKSNRCSKTEAALLCALDYCSDKIKAQRKVKKMAAIAFDVDDCHIEVKNVPVVWEKRKK